MASPAKLNDDTPGSVTNSSSNMSNRVRDDAPVKPGRSGNLREASDLPKSPVGQAGSGGHTPGSKGPKSADPVSAGTKKATNKALDHAPGTVRPEDQGAAEKQARAAAGKAANVGTQAALDSTGVGATVGKAAGDAVEEVVKRVDVKKVSVGCGLGCFAILLLLSIPILVFFYVATHPWDAVKKVITDSSFRRFALSAAGLAAGEGSSRESLAYITGAMPYEVDYKPGAALAAPPGQKPEPGSLEETISKIDYEKSRNKFKSSYCEYKVITKPVVSYDGQRRSVIDKVVDKEGRTADMKAPGVYSCILEQYPVMEAMMRSPEARKINQQKQVNLNYAEKKDSEVLKGKDKKEVKEALHKKSLTRLWSNPDSPYGNSTECIKDFRPTGSKVDRSIKKVINDLSCGTQPEKIDVDYKVEEIPKSLDTDSAKYEKRLIQYTKAACVFYKKLNEDKDAVKKYKQNRAKSSARAGFQALTLADTGVAGEISTDELNGDMYKINNFSTSRAYNQEINGSSAGVQIDPEAIPTRVLGLTKNYFEELEDQGRIKNSLTSLCSKQDNLDDGGFGSFSDFFSGLFGGGGPSKEDISKDIDDALTYLKRDIQKNNSQYYSSADKVTLEDIIVRTIKVTSNASNSGVEDGPDNFNRMTVGAKSSTYDYTFSLFGGSYETAAEGNKASLDVESLKRNRDRTNGIAFRLLNTDNPRSIASRMAAESTATPTQVAEKTTRYAVNMLNPIRAFAEINSAIAYVGYGESNKAIAAGDDDREYWKIDTAGVPQTEDAIQNARYIEALKKKVADPAYANDETIKSVAASFAAWDKCMETYYPDMETLDESQDKACQMMRQSNVGRTLASAYSISSAKYNLPKANIRLAALSPTTEKALAKKYAIYKGHRNLYGAWARLSSDEPDDSIYAKSSGGTSAGAASGPTVEGITYPPNLAGAINGTGYYTMPESDPAGLYVFSGNDRCGSKELVGTIYTVAQQWAKTYPGSTLRIGDLNAGSGHVSHKKGVDVDITVTDRSAANVSGDRNKSIQLGKWFIDTGIIKMILHNDTAVQTAVNEYAKSVGKPGVMKYWAGHDTHFHVRISDEYVQPESLGCPR